jgi:hypothetical protein
MRFPRADFWDFSGSFFPYLFFIGAVVYIFVS